jgi:hypothetical protein
MKMVYMVYKRKNCFLTYNKREALKFAKENDCLVRSLSYQFEKWLQQDWIRFETVESLQLSK